MQSNGHFSRSATQEGELSVELIGCFRLLGLAVSMGQDRLTNSSFLFEIFDKASLMRTRESERKAGKAGGDLLPLFDV